MTYTFLLAVALCVPVRAAVPSTLTAQKADALLEGVEKRADTEHHPGYALSTALAVATSTATPYQTVFYGRQVHKDEVAHTLSRAKGVPGWLLHTRGKNGTRFVRVDADFRPVKSAEYRPGDSEPRPLETPALTEFLAAELALWAAQPAPKAPR